MTLVPTNLELIVGESNIFEIDINTDLDPGDEVYFTAKYRRTDSDANAAILKKRSAGGIVDTDAPQGKCQVQIVRADTLSLTGRALIYDVKVEKVDSTPDLLQTVGKGVIRLIYPVNADAAP